MMLRRRFLAIVVALASLFGAQGFVARPAMAAVDVAAAEAQLLDLLNQDRAAAGLLPVRADARLMEVARWRSEDMVARNFFGHDLGGFTIASILRERQIPFRLAGENIVSNTFDDLSTVTFAQIELMKSPTHRENILQADYNQVGIGVAVGLDRKTVFTQIFVQSMPSATPTATPQTVPTPQIVPTPMATPQSIQPAAPTVAAQPPFAQSAPTTTQNPASAAQPATTGPVDLTANTASGPIASGSLTAFPVATVQPGAAGLTPQPPSSIQPA